MAEVALQSERGDAFDSKRGAFAEFRATIMAGSERREISASIPKRFISRSMDSPNSVREVGELDSKKMSALFYKKQAKVSH